MAACLLLALCGLLWWRMSMRVLIYCSVFGLVILIIVLRWSPPGRQLLRRLKARPIKPITIVYPDEASTADLQVPLDYDVIAVHGLGAHSFFTWTAKIDPSHMKSTRDSSSSPSHVESTGDSSTDPNNMKSTGDNSTTSDDKFQRVNWLKDLVPKKFSNVRIMIFSHNADWIIDAPHTTSYNTAIHLLRSLKKERAGDKNRRPIIFVGHSFGGIVIKDALINATLDEEFVDIIKWTCGVIFLGTPHDGSTVSAIGSFLSSLTPFLGSENGLLKTLGYLSPELIKTKKQFMRWANLNSQRVKIISFYERKKIRIFGMRILRIVEEQSASFDGGETYGLDKSHSGLNKFVDENDPDYISICDNGFLRIFEHSKKTKDFRPGREGMQSPLGTACTSNAIDHDFDISTLIQSLTSEADRTIELSIAVDRLVEISKFQFAQMKSLSEPYHNDSITWFIRSPEYREWESSREPAKFLWYSGLPRSGKTATSIHVLQKLLKDMQFRMKRDVIYVFCTETVILPETTKKVRTTPAWVVCSMLAQLMGTSPDRFENRYQKIFDTPNANKTLVRAANLGRDNFHDSLPQEQRWSPPTTNISPLDVSEDILWEIFGKILRMNDNCEIQIVIDGVDRIEPEEDRLRFLRDLRASFEALKSETEKVIKIMVTSRPYATIREVLKDLPSIDTASEIKECLKSLHFPQYHDRVKDVTRGHERTGEWLWANEKYKAWDADSTSNTLWIQGKPGSGKSTLLKHVFTKKSLEHGLNTNQSTAKEYSFLETPDLSSTRKQTETSGEHGKTIIADFFYSRRGGEKLTSHELMLRSLLWEILYQDERLFPLYQERFRLLNQSEDHLLWRFDDLKSVYESLTTFDTFYLKIYVFVDALDESDETEHRNEMLRLLANPHPGNSRCVIKSIIASRPLTGPQEAILNCAQIKLEDENKSDMERVVDMGIEDLRNTLHMEMDSLTAVKNYLISNAYGVFLWVALVIEDLKNLKNISQVGVDKKLRELPKDLEQWYGSIVSELNKHNLEGKNRAKQMLNWTTLALRPLSLEEFRDALAVPLDFDDAIIDSSEYTLRDYRWYGYNRNHTIVFDTLGKDIVKTCSGFVEIKSSRDDLKDTPDPSTVGPENLLHRTTATAIVQLLHQTAREFLLGNELAAEFKVDGDKELATMAIVCVKYLKLSLSPESSSGVYGKEVERWEDADFRDFVLHLADRPLLRYTFEFLATCDMESVYSSLLGLWENETATYTISSGLLALWIKRLANCGVVISEAQTTFAKQFTSNILVTATKLKAASVVRAILEAGAPMNDFSGKKSSYALLAAVSSGSLDLVTDLIQHGADVNSIGPEDKTALMEAAANGHMEILRIVHQNGAYADARDSHGQSAVHFAAEKGHGAVVELLLSWGADPDSKDVDGQTPLWLAARDGQAAVVELLAKKGAKVDAQARAEGSALLIAASRGHEAVVRKLVENGADINGGWYDNNTLSFSSLQGHAMTAKTLAEIGADPCAQNMVGETALDQAISKGNLEVATMITG